MRFTEEHIADHRFGNGSALGQPPLSDPREYVLDQLEADWPAPPALTFGSWREAIDWHNDLNRRRKEAQENLDRARVEGEAAEMLAVLEQIVADVDGERVRARVDTVVAQDAYTFWLASAVPGYVSRLAWHWANVFAVDQEPKMEWHLAGANVVSRAVVPHVLLNYYFMLTAALKEAAVIRTLDGQKNRKGGLNENLAREVLQIYTVGPVDGAGKPNYAVDDIRAFAAALSGLNLFGEVVVDRHQEGPYLIMGQSFESLDRILGFLAQHPQTARTQCIRLVTGFLGTPAPEVVDACRKAWVQTGGNLKAVAAALVSSDAAWTSEAVQVLDARTAYLKMLKMTGEAPVGLHARSTGFRTDGAGFRYPSVFGLPEARTAREQGAGLVGVASIAQDYAQSRGAEQLDFAAKFIAPQMVYV